MFPARACSAATSTAEIKFTLRAYLREDPSPANALARLNLFLASSQKLDSHSSTNFVCLLLAVVDPKARTGLFTGGGMEPPLLARRGGQVEEILLKGLPLGVAEQAEYMTISREFAPGDILVMVTDGITEARGAQGLFGHERLARLILQVSSLDSLVTIGQIIFDQARMYAGGRLQDDACLLFNSVFVRERRPLACLPADGATVLVIRPTTAGQAWHPPLPEPPLRPG